VPLTNTQLLLIGGAAAGYFLFVRKSGQIALPMAEIPGAAGLPPHAVSGVHPKVWAKRVVGTAVAVKDGRVNPPTRAKRVLERLENVAAPAKKAKRSLFGKITKAAGSVAKVAAKGAKLTGKAAKLTAKGGVALGKLQAQQAKLGAKFKSYAESFGNAEGTVRGAA
jgi:hypothetical protein